MPGVRVDRVLTKDGPTGKRVVGVKAGDDELHSSVVPLSGCMQYTPTDMRA